MKRLTAWLALALAAFTAPLQAQEGNFPSRTVTIVHPYASVAGGLEPVMRLMLSALSEKLGQQFILDLRGGANGAIGMNIVAKAKPDGYTLAFTNLGPTTVLPFAQKDVPYDTGKDLTAVYMIGRGESFIVAGPSVKLADLGEVIKFARENPGKLTYASVGAAQRLNIVKLEAATGAKFLVVPYKGLSDAHAALLGGVVDIAVDTGDPKAVVRGGAIRILSSNNPVRTKQNPQIPVTAEWTPGFESRAWHGIVAPAGTPRERIELLHREFSAIARQPKTRDLMQRIGLEPADLSVDEFAAVIQKELQENARLTKQYPVFQE